jgi:cytochrome c biogenesis protein CcmG, thiol:disulfide interchange protein DsbE
MRDPSPTLRSSATRSLRRLGAAFLLLAATALSAAGRGDAAPAIQLMDSAGKPFSLEALKGQVVVLDFWASWCGPCRKSLPELDDLQTRFASQGVKVVGVSLDSDIGSVTGFLEKVPVRFTILHDPAGRTGEAYSVVAMPTTFLIDQEGRIAGRFEGGAHVQEEAAAVAALLGGTGITKEVRVASGLQATGSLKAWQRGHLADPIMNLDGDRLSAILREHIHASKEGAAGNGGVAGGGCGCN